jgi:hypothetical protein
MFKANEHYPQFPAFTQIEKNLNNYTSHQELAVSVRNIFNEYFIQHVNSPVDYSNTFTYCNFFETLYSGFESRCIMKESRNIVELKKKINKLRKEIKENVQPCNKMKIAICENNTSKKVKYALYNNIKMLNAEQMKGLINVLQDYINVESDRIFEFDIDKVPPHKIKELTKYVNKCMKERKKAPVREESVKEETVQKIVETRIAMLSDSDSMSSDDESNDV